MKKVAVILAAGNSSRFGGDLPKQFVKIADKTVLENTVYRFANTSQIDHIIVATLPAYMETTQELLANYDVTVVGGGSSRNESLKNAIEAYGEDFIVVSHDAARPHVSKEIIKNNIEMIEDYDCVGTAIKATDTIVLTSDDGLRYLDRRNVLHMQTPQTFRSKDFLDLYEDSFTDVCGLFIEHNKKVGFAEGHAENIKITTKSDL